MYNKTLHGGMGGWRYGWVINYFMDGRIARYFGTVCGWKHGFCVGVLMDALMYGCMDGRMDRWIEQSGY